MMVRCNFMPNDEVLPELMEALESNFSEMKIGEEHFQPRKDEPNDKIEQQKPIIYQKKYSSENQTGKLLVKPIKATKELIDSPIDVKDEHIHNEDVGNEGETIQKKIDVILDKPPSSFGDDFDVEW